MSEETTRDFLAALWECQERAGMTNAALSRALDVTPAYVHHLKNGRPGQGKRLGLAVALAACRTFPELTRFLSLDLPVSNNIGPVGNEKGPQ